MENTTVQAIDKVFLFRFLSESGNAWKIAFQTDSETDESRSYDSEPTKDGSVKAVGAYEGTHSLTSFLSTQDEYVKKLKGLVRSSNPDKLEVWEIDRTNIKDSQTTTLPGDYSVDVVTNVNTSAGAEGNVEIGIETEVEGTIVSGDVNVTSELRSILRQITSEREFVQPMQQGE